MASEQNKMDGCITLVPLQVLRGGLRGWWNAKTRE